MPIIYELCLFIHVLYYIYYIGIVYYSKKSSNFLYNTNYHFVLILFFKKKKMSKLMNMYINQHNDIIKYSSIIFCFESTPVFSKCSAKII